MSQTKAQLINGKSATIEFTGGSASAPAVSFTGDTNTGIYSPGGDQVAISTNGTGRLFVDGSGRILVGTASSSIGGSGSIILQGSAGPGVVRAAFGGTSPGSTDILGAITFTDSSHTGAAYIYGSRDGGTWTSTTSQPSAITFGTTPNGSGTAFERLRITSAGLVGIGTNPASQLHVNGQDIYLTSNGTLDDNRIRFSKFNFTGNSVGAALGYTYGVANTQESGSLVFYTNPNSSGTGSLTERARIDSSGRLLVGTSSSTGSNVKAVFGAGLASSDGVLVVNTNDQAINGITISNWDGATTTNGPKILFSNSAIGEFIIGGGNGTNRFEVFNGVGTGVFLTSGNTSWTSTSDERLKTDLVPIENAINRVNTLRAVTGRFNTDEEGVSRGFLIAQDVQSVFPEAVDDSNPDELGVRYTEIIPLLVAALKESKHRIETLEASNTDLLARVSALESS